MELDTSRFLVIGESLAAGMTNFSLIEDDQRDSFSVQMARQIGEKLVTPFFQAPGLGDAPGFPRLPCAALVAAAGFAGALLDSLLGSAFQARYRKALGTEGGASIAGQNGEWTLSELRGDPRSPNLLTHGLRWMTNDTVNLISSSAAAGAAAILFAFLR